MAIISTNSRLPMDKLTILVAVGLCLLVLSWVFLRTNHVLSENFRQSQAQMEHQATAMDSLPASTSVPSSTTSVPPRNPITLIDVAEVRPSADLDPPSAAAPGPAPTAPVPIAPRLPFNFIGRVHDDRGWTVLLVKNETKYIARQGDVLEGAWHIETIDEEGIAFRHTPTGTREHLALTPQGTDAPASQLAPIAHSETASSNGVAIRQYAPGHAASTQISSDEAAMTVAPPPSFQRRIAAADIPREPWVCEASRANALLPCRNTWSMSEAQRVTCRQAAEGSYKSCLGRAMTAQVEEE
jgi:hypothetical protein